MESITGEISKAAEFRHQAIARLAERLFVSKTPKKDVRSWPIPQLVKITKAFLAKYGIEKKIPRYMFMDQGNFIFYSDFRSLESKLNQVYDMLADQESKKLFEWLIKARLSLCLLGEDIFFNEYQDKNYWDSLAAKAQKFLTSASSYTIQGFTLNAPAGENIVDFSLVSLWLADQYRIPGICEPKVGDVVIDGGGFIGDTAIWFSQFVGPQGKVYCFEPNRQNFSFIQENLAKNNIQNVVPLEMGLSQTSQQLKVQGKVASGSRLGQEGDYTVNCVSLDEFCVERQIKQVDFIKLDVEGLEKEVLLGAEQTIRKYLPKLTISLYHKPEDMYELPLLIKSFSEQYKLYIRHKSSSNWETVLYAVA